MESIASIADTFEPPFAEALAQRDEMAVTEHTRLHVEQDGPLTPWLESVGTRLQLRDMLLVQKESLALTFRAPMSGQTMAREVGNFMRSYRTDLLMLSCVDERMRQVADESMLRQQRMHRLLKESPRSLMSVIEHFGQQSPKAVLSANALLARSATERLGLQGRLALVQQAYREKSTRVTVAAMARQTSKINDHLDAQIKSVMFVRSAA
ncbi:hypothetical protein BH09PAT3_BH09PAT3_5000 [soil metagenome]